MSACAILVIFAELADCVDISGSAALVDLADFVDLGGLADSPYLVDMADLFTLGRLEERGGGPGLCGDLAGRFSRPR